MRRSLSTITITMALASLTLSGCSESLTKEESCAAVTARVELALESMGDFSTSGDPETDKKSFLKATRKTTKDLDRISRDANNKEIESLVSDISESLANVASDVKESSLDDLEELPEGDSVEAFALSAVALGEACEWEWEVD